MSKPTDLVQGTPDLLTLTVIALEPMHGWAIAGRKALEQEAAQWERLSGAIALIVRTA